MKAWKPYYSIWFVMGFAWFTNILVRVGLSPALPQLQIDLGISHSEAGLLASAVFYSYTMMQIPSGFIGDLFGRKIVVLAASLVWAMGALFTGVASGFHQIAAARFLTGLGQGSFFSNDRPIIHAATPQEKAGVGQGISFGGLGLGMGLGIILAGLITESLGWRWVFFLFGGVSFLASLLIWRFIKEPARVVEAGDEHVSKRLVLKSRDLWKLYIGGIAAIYTIWFLGTWTPSMIKEVTGAGLGYSSLIASLAGFSALLGLPILGYLSDITFRRGGGRKLVGGLSYVACAASMGVFGWAIQQGTTDWMLPTSVFFAGFFSWGSWGPIYSMMADIVPKKIMGLAFGVVNCINFFGSLIAPWLSGYVRDVTGSFSLAVYIAAGLMLGASILIFAVSPAFRWGPEISLVERLNWRRRKLA